MKTEFTVNWHKKGPTFDIARWGSITMICRRKRVVNLNITKDIKFMFIWEAVVRLGSLLRVGPQCQSIAKAKKSAETLAKELLLDVIEGAERLKKQYDV